MLAQALMTIAHQHVSAGDPADALAALREAVEHAYDAGDRISVGGATVDSILAFAALGLDVAVARCAGALVAGVFAPGGFNDASGRQEAALAGARVHLGEEGYEGAYARGAVADYDDFVAFILETLCTAVTASH